MGLLPGKHFPKSLQICITRYESLVRIFLQIPFLLFLDLNKYLHFNICTSSGLFVPAVAVAKLRVHWNIMCQSSCHITFRCSHTALRNILNYCDSRL